MWSGCRLTHGVLQGKVGFEVRLERKLLPSQLEEQEEGGRMDQLYGLRVGWSVDNSSLLLGKNWVYCVFFPVDRKSFERYHHFLSVP